MRYSCLFLLACLIPGPLLAQKTSKPTKDAVSGATVERVVRTLAADDLRGRASGQPGSLKAAEFLATEFKRLKLQPLPGLNGYEQTFSAYEAHTTELKAMLNGQPIAPKNVLLVGNPLRLRWTDTDAASPRVRVIGAQDPLRTQMRDILRPRENQLVLLDHAHAADFQKLIEYQAHGRIRADSVRSVFSSVVILTSALPTGFPKFEVSATTVQQPLVLRNVVGVLPGRDKARAAEQVVFSAHYDHIGILPAVAGDSIANGADDDASGTAAVVALAEYFKKRKDNARTLVFVAFTAEEIGGFGSQYFSRQLKPEQVVAMFNIEMIGKPAVFGPNSAFITGFDKSDFGKLLQANLQGTPFRFEPDPYPAQNLFYRSDNATLARLGVPAHSISTDQIPTDKLYHSVDDEVESLDLQNMTAVVTAIARSAAGIVAGQQTPTRIAPEK